MADDDYWNTSDTKALAFDFDDELSPQEIMAIGQKPLTAQKVEALFSDISITTIKSAEVPLSSLVSSKALELIILANSGKKPGKEAKLESEETVEMTLKRLTLGRSCSLYVHRSLDSKKKLLDGAIAIGDGNAVLAVVLFIVRTLDVKLMSNIILPRREAVANYAAFLYQVGNMTELKDFMALLGEDIAIMYKLRHIATRIDDPKEMQREIFLLHERHRYSMGTWYERLITDYLTLLGSQNHINKPELRGASAVQTLAYICEHHPDAELGTSMCPVELCKRQGIDGMQKDWVVINVHAKTGRWGVLESLYITKDWRGRTTISTKIPVEMLLARLSKLHASDHLLGLCLQELPNNEERLRYAQLYKIHSVVIDMLAKQKDRVALTNYKMTLNPQSDAYLLAEKTLRDAPFKWKN